MSNFSDWIKRDMEARGLNESQYANHFGIKQQNVNNWLNGTIPSANNIELQKLAAGAGTTVATLLELCNQDRVAKGKKPQGNIPKTAREAVAKINGPIFMTNTNDLPIRGLSAGGDMERVVFSSNDIYAHAERPPSLVGIDEAYGVEMREMSMADRYLPNRDILHVNPRAPLYPGEFVVIHVLDKSTDQTIGFVKQFKGYDGDKAVFTQLNPPKTLRFKREDIVAIDVIVGTGRK